jgi:UBX domain-containing protein 1
MPPELLVNGKAPDINLVDKRTEKYVAPPPPAYTAYSGGGHSLSNGNNKAETSTIFQPSSSSSGATKEPEVDASAATCRISIRTADGKRLVGKFNTTHTVHDLQAYIDANSSNTSAYQLLLGRPPKPIEVSGMSLEAAGLKNQSLMQKLC